MKEGKCWKVEGQGSSGKGVEDNDGTGNGREKGEERYMRREGVEGGSEEGK